MEESINLLMTISWFSQWEMFHTCTLMFTYLVPTEAALTGDDAAKKLFSVSTLNLNVW